MAESYGFILDPHGVDPLSVLEWRPEDVFEAWVAQQPVPLRIEFVPFLDFGLGDLHNCEPWVPAMIRESRVLELAPDWAIIFRMRFAALPYAPMPVIEAAKARGVARVLAEHHDWRNR